MMERLDRLALLLAGHRRTVHDRSAHRERLAILFVPDPDDVSLANPRIRFRDPGGHHVRAVVDEPDRSHVDGHGALRRGEREETPDRGCDPVADDEGDRFLPAKYETLRPRLRLVDRDVVDGDRHAALARAAADQGPNRFPRQTRAASA